MEQAPARAETRSRYYGGGAVHNGEVPELPEVEALAAVLAARAVGTTIGSCRLTSFAALKTVSPTLDDLVGRTVTGLERRGKHLCLDAEGLWLVVHLARGGWIRWYDSPPPATARPGRGPLALRVRLDGDAGFDVTEMGTEKRLAIWVVGAPGQVESVARLGVDPLSR